MQQQQFHDQIMACALAKGIKGNPEAVRDQRGMPLVRPCAIQEAAKQAAGTATPAPRARRTNSVVTPAIAVTVQPTFIAPPRTIADITAILDSEKPDDAKIAARKAEADAAPPSNVLCHKACTNSTINRGAARALLARRKMHSPTGCKLLIIASAGSKTRLIDPHPGIRWAANTELSVI